MYRVGWQQQSPTIGGIKTRYTRRGFDYDEPVCNAVFTDQTGMTELVLLCYKYTRDVYFDCVTYMSEFTTHFLRFCFSTEA